jgi:hypothetical protein
VYKAVAVHGFDQVTDANDALRGQLRQPLNVGKMKPGREPGRTSFF